MVIAVDSVLRKSAILAINSKTDCNKCLYIEEVMVLVSELENKKYSSVYNAVCLSMC